MTQLDDGGVLVADAGRAARPAPLDDPGRAANAIFEYLEIVHNRTRRHGALGMLTPIQFENVATVA